MKKYLLGFFAVVFAVAFSAFSTRVVNVYKFTGADNTELSNPAYWDEGMGTAPSCGELEGTVCHVQVTSNSGIEDLQAFQQFILELEPEDVDALIGAEEIQLVIERAED